MFDQQRDEGQFHYSCLSHQENIAMQAINSKLISYIFLRS
jgi:hypothetical protein